MQERKKKTTGEYIIWRYKWLFKKIKTTAKFIKEIRARFDFIQVKTTFIQVKITMSKGIPTLKGCVQNSQVFFGLHIIHPN